jgi:UDP-N-acetyl-D-galactosamine dehydrogenase
MVIAVVGLGYVGLPLVIEFGKRIRTIGFDAAKSKVFKCQEGTDPSREIPDHEMRQARYAEYSADPACLTEADIIIVAVPTPLGDANRPDLGPLKSASTIVGQHMKRGAVVVYESTVYPCVTEDVCIPALEKGSGMVWKRDFNVGYSPERINPGDRAHSLTNVVKVVSGDTPETLAIVREIYQMIVKPGVHACSSIKVAEACKVIENTQRDLNIALMNELAIIFEKIGIDTQEVIDAAGTKWNFLKFAPGLVGGHCIGVDPYYLTHKAEMLGYHPQVILAGRRINDGMGKYVAQQTVKRIIANGRFRKGSVVNILGLTFKENCADLRNSKVMDIIHELETFGTEVFVHDSRADPEQAMQEYGIALTQWQSLPRGDAIVAAVPHIEYCELRTEQLMEKLVDGGCFTDVKSMFNASRLAEAGATVWRL